MKLFEVGDHVFDIRYGWGKAGIIYGDGNNIIIGVYGYKGKDVLYYNQITTDISVHENISLLSLTEYTLEGFTQRTINKLT